MITLRIDIKKPHGFGTLAEVLRTHVGVMGKNWTFQICDRTAYGDPEDDDFRLSWDKMYLLDVHIRSHKKATLFALAWEGVKC